MTVHAASAEAFERLARELVASERNVFWLDSGPAAERGLSYLGSGTRVIESRNGRVSIDGAPVEGDVLDVLRAEIATGPAAAAPPDGAAFAGGWVGWFSYEFGARLMGLDHASGGLPEAAFVRSERLWSYDHATGRIEEILAPTTPEGSVPDPPAAIAPIEAASVDEVTVAWRHDRAAYLRAIDACLDAIRRGDAYQLCLTNAVEVAPHAEPFAVYERLRRSNPAPHGGFLRIGGVSIASSSPERFLRVDADGTIETRPIKGTRRRDPDPGTDAALAAELRDDEKERAENLMIVDLMRNDLGRIAGLGTVDVPSLFAVESFPSVHQLVSTVTARLAPGLDALDVVRASFPAGSMTGAPKRRAMETLHELEHGPRGIYSGAFGWIGADGALDLAMVIRSIVFSGGRARLGTGGGITAQSVPEREVEEIVLKARAMLDALDAPVALPGSTEGTGNVGRRVHRPVRRFPRSPRNE